tara:strand:+ start:2382 stop:2498 length:117 start_codon:yes stop_codon:yes gene_type:complete
MKRISTFLARYRELELLRTSTKSEDGMDLGAVLQNITV